jgi:preprotein translocase subunit SecG
MTTILLIIHLLIAVTMVGVILLQRSEGGALGIGGGGGGGGFMTGRGQANLLTRVTAILAVSFITTSMLLAIIAAQGTQPRSILDQPPGIPAAPTPTEPATPAPPSPPVAD